MDELVSCRSRSWRARVSILAALPLLVLKLVFLADVEGWHVALGYGLIHLLLPAFVIGLLGYLALESFLRRKSQGGIGRFPWFTPIVAAALLTFFFMHEVARPVVKLNPQWCYVNQVIEWTAPNNEFFVLIMTGDGNVADHEFNFADLHWTGSEPVRVPLIDFRPIRFRDSKSDRVVADATSDELRRLLAPSGLTDDQLDSLAPAIWDVLQQANDGESISSSTGKVEPAWDRVASSLDFKLGGAMWMTVLLALFLTIGQLTLTKPERKLAI